MSSCRQYTGCHVDRKQVTSTLIRAVHPSARFDSFWNPFRCVSNGSLALTFSSLTWRLMTAVSPTAARKADAYAHHHSFWLQQHGVV